VSSAVPCALERTYLRAVTRRLQAPGSEGDATEAKSAPDGVNWTARVERPGPFLIVRTNACACVASRGRRARRAIDASVLWRYDRDRSAGLTQLVECQLPKLDVASSNLVSRSKNPQDSGDAGRLEVGEDH
jgi:hypothetical protein